MLYKIFSEDYKFFCYGDSFEIMNGENHKHSDIGCAMWVMNFEDVVCYVKDEQKFMLFMIKISEELQFKRYE